MNIFTTTFTGNLVDNTSITHNTDLGKTIYKFTVANNISEKYTNFFTCEYWTKLKEDEKDSEEDKKSLKNILTKGKKVTVLSNFVKTNEWENDKGEKNRTFIFTVHKLEF